MVWLTVLLLLSGCGASERPLGEWTGCVLEDHPIDIVNTGSNLFPDVGPGEADMLTIGAAWRGLELTETRSSLFVELPVTFGSGDALELAEVDTLYVRSQTGRMLFATRQLAGALRLTSVDGDIERYAIDALADRPEIRGSGQPDSVSLVGNVTIRRTASPTCQPPSVP